MRFHQPEKLLPLLGIKKFEENWFTSNFKHCVHQQKKAPNKSTKFVINRKFFSTSQNKGFLEKCDFTGLKSYFHSSQYLKKKMRKTVSSSRNKIFFPKYRPPCNGNNGFQKNLNEKISSALNRKSVATGCNEEFF